MALAADSQALYDHHRLFDLRDAVLADPAAASPFHRAVVGCAFPIDDGCPRAVREFLATNPPDDLGRKAFELLWNYHFARGEWAEVIAADDADTARHGRSDDPAGMRELLRVLAAHGSVSAERVAPTRIRTLYKHGHVPIAVEGRRYLAYVDTGANLSMLSQSAARQLGLHVETARFRFGGAAGGHLDLSSVAVADRFSIGNIHLRNVPFVIIPDSREPFRSWGAGKRCVLGIQILIAARSMAWKRAFPFAALELANAPAVPPDPHAANFCWDGKTPLFAAEYRGRRLTLVLDTGMGHSNLRPAFAEAAPDAVANLPHYRLGLSGIDGDSSVEAVFLRNFELSVDSRPARFRKVPVHLKGKNLDLIDGVFGTDFPYFTLDFRTLRLTLQ